MIRCSRRSLIDTLNILLVLTMRPVNHAPGRLYISAGQNRLRLSAYDLLCSANIDIPAMVDYPWQASVQHGDFLRIVQAADSETISIAPAAGGDQLQVSGKRVTKRCFCSILPPADEAEQYRPDPARRICNLPAAAYAAALYRTVPAVSNANPPGVVHTLDEAGLELAVTGETVLVKLDVPGAHDIQHGERRTFAISAGSAAMLSEVLKPAANCGEEVLLSFNEDGTRLVVEATGVHAEATLIARSSPPAGALIKALLGDMSRAGSSRITFNRRQFERLVVHPRTSRIHNDWGPQITWNMGPARNGVMTWGPTRSTEADRLKIELAGPPVQTTFHEFHIWVALRAINAEQVCLQIPWTPSSPYLLSSEQGNDRVLFSDGSAEMRQIWQKRAAQVEPAGGLSWHELAAALWNPQSPLVHNRTLHRSLRGYTNRTDPVGSAPWEVRAWGIAVGGVQAIQELLLHLLTRTDLFELSEDGEVLVVGAPHELMDWAPFRLALMGGQAENESDRFWATILSGQIALGLNGLEIGIGGLPSAERIGIMIMLYERLRETNADWPSLIMLDQTSESGQYTLIAGYPLGTELMVPSANTPIKIGDWFDRFYQEPGELCLYWFPHPL